MKAKYTDDGTCQKPTNENAKIWRYMDFTKFVSLLDKKALFFCRSDKLGDSFEGSISKVNVKLRPKIYKRFPEGMTSEHLKRFVIINCWNLSEYESVALWKLYVKDTESVAVQSTFKRLTQSFSSSANDYVLISKIKYVDYKTEMFPEDSFVTIPFWHKRRNFEHEQELRAIIMRFPSTYFLTAPDIFDIGEYVDVNLDVLIENVYVSPTAQEWFRDTVESVMKKYGINKIPIRSNLDDAPVY